MSESDREHALDETLKFNELVFEHECVLRQTIIGALETHFGKVIDNIRSEESLERTCLMSLITLLT